MGKGVQVFGKPLSVLFPESVGFEIDIDIEIGDGGAEHAAVLTIDGPSLSIQLDELLVQAVAETSPVGALNALDIECFSQHHQA
jgi:hypothetical protein